MSFTYEQIERIADQLRSAGFDPSDMDNDQIGLLAACVLEALEFEPKPSWEDAPEWARYLCIEHDGIWCWHEAKPSMFYGDYVSSGLKATAKCVKLGPYIEQRP